MSCLPLIWWWCTEIPDKYYVFYSSGLGNEYQSYHDQQCYLTSLKWTKLQMLSLWRWMSSMDSPTVSLQGFCFLPYLSGFSFSAEEIAYIYIDFFLKDLLQAQQMLFVPGGKGLGWISFIHLSICLFFQQALLKADFGAWWWSIRWMVWFFFCPQGVPFLGHGCTNSICLLNGYWPWGCNHSLIHSFLHSLPFQFLPLSYP